MTEKMAIPMRLALRVEGDWWVAYIAQPGTMHEAIECGRILMRIVEEDDDSREAFKLLMTEFVQRFIKEQFGKDADMVEQPAPEHERGGKA